MACAQAQRGALHPLGGRVPRASRLVEAVSLMQAGAGGLYIRRRKMLAVTDHKLQGQNLRESRDLGPEHR